LSQIERAAIEQQVRSLGPWFHQIDLGDGLLTRDIAPTPGISQPRDHPLSRWLVLKDAIPADLSGKRVLDIGCAEGFFALEMARRGADVVAMDAAPNMIRRLDWLISHFSMNNIQTKIATIESLDKSKEKYDLILMIGLLYHLRNPQQGLDIVGRMTDTLYVESALHKKDDGSYLYLQPPIEGVHSIPKWMPTESCVLAMLRFTGFPDVKILDRAHPQRGIYLARR
jgi:tRNA (mo5U34)-methyltransferase